jgi:hypothetical protein
VLEHALDTLAGPYDHGVTSQRPTPAEPTAPGDPHR